MRYPLISFHGNMGSRDGDPPAAYRYCVTGDTLIQTNKGTLKIQDIVKNSEENQEYDIQLTINGYKSENYKATKFFNSGKHPVYKIKLKNGMEISGTSNHPLMVLDSNLNFSWKTIEELNVNDKVLLNKNNSNALFGDNDNLLEAKALGCLISEGYLTTQDRIGINNTDIELINPVKDFFENLDENLTAKINYNDTKKYYEYCVVSKKISSIFLKEYLFGDSFHKKLPSNVLKGTKKYQKIFLKYLFEGDGSASIPNNNIVYTSVSLELLKQLQIILLQNFGIFSFLQSEGKNRTAYRINISGESVIKFAKQIGFVSDRKNNIVREIIDNYNNTQKIASNSYYNIQEVSEYIRKINTKSEVKKYSFSNTKNFYRAINYISNEEYNRLENLIKNYLYIPIVEKELLPEEEIVYSIRVDDESHSFIANGFINHNTECKLSKIGEEMLADIKKDTVDWSPAYTNEENEPVYLPGTFPNALVNGTTGIAVALATSLPANNLTEMMNAIILVNKNPEASIDDLLEYVKGPDFPTGGQLINKDELREAYMTGRGRARVRAEYKIETNKGKDSIVFTSLPYKVSKETLTEDIDKLCEQNKLTGISTIRDESGNGEVRFVIELEKGISSESMLSKLFKLTRLEDTFSFNQVCLVDKTPKLLNLKQMIEIYIAHQKDVLIRKTTFDKNKVEARLHILNGLLKALEDIDNIIALIKKSESAAAAKESLISQYEFSEIQAKAILDMKLSKLAKLEKVEIEKETSELNEKLESLNAILANPTPKLEEIFTRIRDTYGDERRTKITQVAVSKEEKEIEFVEPEKCVVIMTEGGLIKRVPASSFRSQRRNGKGVKTQDDITQAVIRTNTIDSLMVFTNKGKMYRLLVNDVPVGTNTTKGQSIKSLINMETDEEPAVIYSIYRDTDAKFVLFTTKNGLVKKTTLEEYIKTKRKSGVAAINIKEGDELVSVSLVKDEQLIILTKQGMGIRFNSAEVGATGRATAGIKAINLKPEDEIVACLPVRDLNDNLAVFSKKGLGKKLKLKEIPLQKRAGRGLIVYKVSDSSGYLSAAALISDTDNVLVLGDISSICIQGSEIPLLGRTATGNQVIKNSGILSVSKV